MACSATARLLLGSVAALLRGGDLGRDGLCRSRLGATATNHRASDYARDADDGQDKSIARFHRSPETAVVDAGRRRGGSRPQAPPNRRTHPRPAGRVDGGLGRTRDREGDGDREARVAGGVGGAVLDAHPVGLRRLAGRRRERRRRRAAAPSGGRPWPGRGCSRAARRSVPERRSSSACGASPLAPDLPLRAVSQTSAGSTRLISRIACAQSKRVVDSDVTVATRSRARAANACVRRRLCDPRLGDLRLGADAIELRAALADLLVRRRPDGSERDDRGETRPA